MSNLPRNMNLQAFDPHRAGFVCKYEADANPPITEEADALFQEGMAATSYELIYPKDRRDYARAARLWKQAADLGHWKAALNLAGLHERGLGVEQDTEKAVSIVEGLMKQGVPAAFDKMGTYHMRGIGVKGDTSRAYAFWQLAADMGSSDAQAHIGAKIRGAYDNPGQGFWGNRTIALKMLECSYAQGNATGAFSLGVTIDGNNKSLGDDYGRSLQALHDAVKFGSADSANYLSAAFGDIDPLTGNTIDRDRVKRYSALGDALERNPDLRLPNLDKILPLPPAQLPVWDGKLQTLVDAAKPLVPRPKTTPTPGSQRTGRAHIPQGHALPQVALPPVAERVPMPAYYRGQYIIDPRGERDVVPYSGYWIARVKEQGRDYQRDWNSRQVPLRYAKGETFDATDRRDMGEYARFNVPRWHYLGEAVKLAEAPPPHKVVQGVARMTRVPRPSLYCVGSRPCPRTGVWVGDVSAKHPLAKPYHAWASRQAYVEKGDEFPSPKLQHLDIAPHEVRWLWLDNANEVRPNGIVDVTLSDLHPGNDA